MTVLILSHSANEHADLIAQKCHETRSEFVRVDTDTITDNPSEVLCRSDVTTSPIRSVFIHQAVFTSQSFKGFDDLDDQLARASWANWLDCLEYSLPKKTRWANKPSAIRESGSIGRQLVLAKDLGLETPPALFTNAKSEVLEFEATHGQLVLKPGNLVGLHVPGQRILVKQVHASGIDESILKRSPCLFQKYIPKAYELRVHVIGDLVLTCRIESQHSEKARVDWRNYEISKTPHYRHDLDLRVAARCMKMCKLMNLGIGIIDLIVKPNGEHVFLEVNSQGHWKWIEQLTELPITDAVWKYLCS